MRDIPIEWIHCDGCGNVVIDRGAIVYDTDRAGNQIDIEHECNPDGQDGRSR